MNQSELKNKAQMIWNHYRLGGRPAEFERSLLIRAYWENLLPKDNDYNVSQWVEDDFPELG